MHLSNLVNFQCRKYSNIGCRFDILRSEVHIQCDWSRKKLEKEDIPLCVAKADLEKRALCNQP